MVVCLVRADDLKKKIHTNMKTHKHTLWRLLRHVQKKQTVARHTYIHTYIHVRKIALRCVCVYRESVCVLLLLLVVVMVKAQEVW